MHKCTLEIKDEVNVRFVGLDPKTRRKMKEAVQFFLPHARYMPAYTLGRWDGTMSFCDVGGRTYINLLDKLLPIVTAAGYEIELDDWRKNTFGDIQFTPSDIQEDYFSHKTWPKGHPNEGEPIMFRDYQVEIIRTAVDNLQSMQEIATGAGKTLITAGLSALVEPYGRSVVIVPNKDLVNQTEKDYKNLGLDVGVLFGDRKEFDKMHTICTWQSLEVLRKAAKKGDIDAEAKLLYFSESVCVIADECFAAGTLVLTPSGYVPIEELTVGDTVINYDQQTSKFKEDVVVKCHTNLEHTASEKMYELKMDNGDVIKVTGNHKFLTKTGWVRADELTTSHDIVSFENNISTQNKG